MAIAAGYMKPVTSVVLKAITPLGQTVVAN